MKKKYYLNGKLVRTSENDYEYAVVSNYKKDDEMYLIACCGNYDLALKRQRQEINYRSSGCMYCQLSFQRGEHTIDVVKLKKV